MRLETEESVLILSSLCQLVHDGQSTEPNIQEAVGFQLNSPKWYFYTNVVQTFQFTLNGLNSGQVQKSFCPGQARIWIHPRPELGFLTISLSEHGGEVISE